MGPTVLAPPATFDPGIITTGLIVHFLMSLLFTSILAIITHRWGLITGIILGGLFGLGLYFINIYTMTIVFPWFIALKHNGFAWAHVIFGMCAGGVYELLEIERFEGSSVSSHPSSAKSGG